MLYFSYTQAYIGGALSVILYFLVFLLGAHLMCPDHFNFWPCNLFLVIEPTGRISLASFSDLQCCACDQSCCLSGLVSIQRVQHCFFVVVYTNCSR